MPKLVIFFLSVHKSDSEGQPGLVDVEETIGKQKTVQDATLITDGAKAFSSYANNNPELGIDHHYISHGTDALKKNGFTRIATVVTIRKYIAEKTFLLI